MNTLLLLGAGFNRNWGGWLADEVVDYLLAGPEVREDRCKIPLATRKVGRDCQLYIKLHDSSNWKSGEGQRLLVM